MLANQHAKIERDADLYRDLRAAAHAPPVRAAFAACGRVISAADHRPMPYLRWWIDGPPHSVTTIELDASPLSKLLLVPRATRLPRRFYRENLPRIQPPAGWRELYENRSYRVYAAPDCRA